MHNQHYYISQTLLGIDANYLKLKERQQLIDKKGKDLSYLSYINYLTLCYHQNING